MKRPEIIKILKFTPDDLNRLDFMKDAIEALCEVRPTSLSLIQVLIFRSSQKMKSELSDPITRGEIIDFILEYKEK